MCIRDRSYFVFIPPPKHHTPFPPSHSDIKRQFQAYTEISDLQTLVPTVTAFNLIPQNIKPNLRNIPACLAQFFFNGFQLQEGTEYNIRCR